MPENKATLIHERPAELLQNLIRFDTTNPPGNERPCIEYINNLLKDAGIETTIVARTPERPNLIARLKGEGKAPPLLLYGHVDVVTTEGQKWTHPPFEAKIADGYIWGRGALDMKGEITMFLAALLKAKASGFTPPGDVIFAATADEEVGSEFGASYLVGEHPDLFKSVKYGLSEFGGFNLQVAGKRFYPIQIAEKQTCPVTVTFHGQPGHGAMPVQGQAMAKLAAALQILDHYSLPVHITTPARLMIDSFADALGGIPGLVMRQFLNPVFTNILLKAMGRHSSLFSPLLHNTVSPTMLQASDKRNVIPGEVVLGLDCRLLPGFPPAAIAAELRQLLKEDCDIQVNVLGQQLSGAQGREPDMSLFGTLSRILREQDTSGISVPYVSTGVTDARFFNRLGIQTYGFTPLKMPDDLDFIATIHGADERVLVDALEFGTQAILRVIQRFHLAES